MGLFGKHQIEDAFVEKTGGRVDGALEIADLLTLEDYLRFKSNSTAANALLSEIDFVNEGVTATEKRQALIRLFNGSGSGGDFDGVLKLYLKSIGGSYNILELSKDGIKSNKFVKSGATSQDALMGDGSTRKLLPKAVTSSGSGSDTGYWTKVASINFGAETQEDFTVTLLFQSVAARGQTALVSFSGRQDTSSVIYMRADILAMSDGAASVHLFGDTNFKIVENGFGNDIEIWVQKSITYGQVEVMELAKFISTSTASFTYYNNNGWIATEPTGNSSVKTNGLTYNGVRVLTETYRSLPTATDPTHAINLGQAGLPDARTGTDVDLSTYGGTLNYGAASGALEYTVSNLKLQGHRVCSINAASEPKVWTGTYEVDGTTKIYYPKISGATFQANTNMEMVVESKDGVDVRYFFLSV